MSDNYYEKLKEIKNKDNVVETNIVEAKEVIEEAKDEQANEFYKTMFESQGKPNLDPNEQFQKANYAHQVKFILQRRFSALSLLFGIFGVTMVITSIIGLLANMTDANLIESIEGINWEVTDENMEMMKMSFMIIYGVQITMGLAMLYCAYYAKMGHINALKIGRIVTIVAIIFAGLALEIINLLILGMIFMNIRTTSKFINDNINNFN